MRVILRATIFTRRVGRGWRAVRVAGMWITRQRPGDPYRGAKGFVLPHPEDETPAASNIIVRPDLFAQPRRLVSSMSPFLIVDGVLQSQDA